MALVCAEDPAPDPEHTLNTQKDCNSSRKRLRARHGRFPDRQRPDRNTDTDTGHRGVSDPSGARGTRASRRGGVAHATLLSISIRTAIGAAQNATPPWGRATDRKLLPHRRLPRDEVVAR